MPELPEVETMRRIVERELVGRTAAEVRLRLPKLVRDSPLPDLSLIIGQRVVAARRRAKVLVIDWSGDLSWLLHFKLAGQLAVLSGKDTRHVAGHPVPDPAGVYPHKSTHLTVRFADDTLLHLSDIRQFGWLRMLPTADVAAHLAGFDFGPEGTGADAITVDTLGERLGRRRIPLKTALLDQTLVAGLGNIYVDEALHHARLHPNRAANSLSHTEMTALHAAIGWALERGIEQGGAKIIHGRAHPRDQFPAVHGRAGEPCFGCATPIVKIRVGARGTYFCPNCQPEPTPGSAPP